MFNRETLNKSAQDLQAKYVFKDGERELSANSEIFHANISREFAIFADFIKVSRTDDEISGAKKPVQSAIALYNDEQRMIRLESLKAIPGRDAMRSYMDDQCVKGFELKLDKNAGWVVSATNAIELDAFDFVSTICATELNGILDACCIFVDNVAKNEFGADAAISRKSMHDSYIEMRERKKWTLPKDTKATNKALAKQLTDVCNMISYKTAPEMKNADVKYVKFFVINARSKANSAGGFVVRNDATIVKAIFRAMYTRHNNLPYEWQNQNGSDKNAARTSNANKDMSESGKLEEFGPKVEAEAGPVTLGEAQA